MRIALDFASQWESRGGVWRYGIELSRALCGEAAIAQVNVPCFNQLPAERISDIRCSGARVHHSGPEKYLGLLDSLSARRGRIVPWNRFLPQLLKGGLGPCLLGCGVRAADVYHSLFWLRPYRPACRMVVTIYDMVPLLRQTTSIAVDRFQHNLHLAKDQCGAVIVPSRATRRDLTEIAGFDERRVHVVYLGVNHESFCAAADRSADDTVLRKYSLVRDSYILYVGAMEERKNVQRLVEAHQLAAVKKAIDCPLILSGHVMPNQANIMARVQAGKFGGGVRYIGYCADSELPALYRGARAFAFPSEYEGFGLPVLEAMACGVPVVTSSTSSLGEIAGNAALTVHPEDTRQIADALVRVVSDESLRADLRDRGIRHASEFTWQRTAQETIAVYAAT